MDKKLLSIINIFSTQLTNVLSNFICFFKIWQFYTRLQYSSEWNSSPGTETQEDVEVQHLSSEKIQLLSLQLI